MIVGRRRRLAGCGMLVAAGLLAAACSAQSATATGPAAAVPSSSGEPATSSTTTGSTDPTEGTGSTAPTSPADPRTITVVMNGDMLLHEGLWESARIDAQRTGRGDMDYRPILADLRPVVRSADLAICHMETPLAPRGGPYSGYPVFSVPPSIVPALKWEGYDACTTASNHSLDHGFSGITRTLQDFAAAGIKTAGTAATEKASRQPLIMDVDTVRVALISATYGTNGFPLPADEPWSVPLIDTATIEAKAAKAKKQGADIVLVALHWGTEYYHPPTEYQAQIADELTRDKDVDLIYGHHAHVVQPYERINGTWVAFGLGNAVAQQDTKVEGVYDGNTCRVTFTERPDGSYRVSKLEYIPTMITHFDGTHPQRWLNVGRAVNQPRYARLVPALHATGQRVTAAVGSLGAFDLGVVRGR